MMYAVVIKDSETEQLRGCEIHNDLEASKNAAREAASRTSAHTFVFEMGRIWFMVAPNGKEIEAEAA